MKIKPSVYAKTLLESDQSDKDIARRFWLALQKNKQYKDLPKILAALDEEYAQKNNAVLVTIFSAKAIEENEITKIREKIEEIHKKTAIIKTIVKPVTGIVARIGDEVIDLSAENKIARLKKVINSD